MREGDELSDTDDLFKFETWLCRVERSLNHTHPSMEPSARIITFTSVNKKFLHNASLEDISGLL